MKFLEHIAKALFEKHGNYLHRLALVFPNRRQSVFFRDYFKQIATVPAFLPQLLTIEELVQLSSLHYVADPLVQSMELYKAYSTVCLAEADKQVPSFEQFYSIGETLLKDFKELDTYLVDVNQVFLLLYELEALEKSFEQLTDEQREFLKRFWTSLKNKGKYQDLFLKLWRRLPAVYELCHEQLQQQQCTSMGMLYRQLAGNQHTNKDFTKAWDHIAFIGFNALNKAEEKIIYNWQQQGFASLWFDADQYYLQDKQQEAGFFLRKNLFQTGLKNEMPVLDVIRQSNAGVLVTGVTGTSAQAKMIAPWLQSLPANERSSAAIILADENLLIPVLQSIPEQAGPVNVTLGYPMQQTVLFSFFPIYFDIINNLSTYRFKYLHFELVKQWLFHPLCDWDEADRSSFIEKMNKGNMLRIETTTLQKKSPITALLLSMLTSTQEIFTRLRQILQEINKRAVSRNDQLLQAAATAAWQAIQTLQPTLSSFKPAPTLAFISQVLRKQMSGMSIALEGEPLKGIQVMGLLESRGLDFDHVLVLGAAEGTLPRVNPPQTFIPDAVRRAFALPVAEFQDAIFAYVFYRLFHRSKTMELVYNALVSDDSTGEPSRFIQQLDFETNISFVYRKPTTSLKPGGSYSIEIAKQADVLKRLGRYLSGDESASISVTQINTYLSCRLQFFLRYLAHLKVPDELSEEIDAKQFGSLVHKLMELLYVGIQEKQGNSNITTSSIEWMKNRVPVELEKAFEQVIGINTGDSSGLEQVIKEVVKQYALRFLEIDEAYTPFKVEELEVPFLEPFSIQAGGTKTIYLKGIIDRVDEKNGVYRMVDYKTGSDKNEFSGIDQLFDRQSGRQNKAALQTLIYSWMFQNKFPGRINFQPALIPLRALAKNGNLETRLQSKAGKIFVDASNIQVYLPEIQSHLKTVLEELFNPEIPFDQTEDLGVCQYCDFAGICNRK
jgi:ATP-dependent helicase/nuclease subunit B